MESGVLALIGAMAGMPASVTVAADRLSDARYIEADRCAACCAMDAWHGAPQVRG